MSKQNVITEESFKRWEPIVNHPDLPKIEESNKKRDLVQVLENQYFDAASSKKIDDGFIRASF